MYATETDRQTDRDTVVAYIDDDNDRQYAQHANKQTDCDLAMKERQEDR